MWSVMTYSEVTCGFRQLYRLNLQISKNYSSMNINLKLYFPHKKTNGAERNMKPPTVYELWK